MVKEFIKDENGYWSSDCERFTEMSLARNLTIIHHENDTPIYYVDEVEDFKLMEHEYVNGMLLERIKSSNKITVNDNIINIFDEDYTEDEEELINTSEVLGVTLKTTPEEFEDKLKETEFLDITPDRIYKKLLAIEHRLKRLESAKEENEADESIEDKLNKLVGTNFYSVGYIKIQECFPPKARSSFTLCKADHGLSDYDNDDEVETYLADSDYTEYYHIVVKNDIIIEIR